MLPKRIVYMHPYSRLIRAQIKESKPAVLIIGSTAAFSSCRTVRIALQDVTQHSWSNVAINTYESNNTDTMLRVCHSVSRESINTSQVTLNREIWWGAVEIDPAICVAP